MRAASKSLVSLATLKGEGGLSTEHRKRGEDERRGTQTGHMIFSKHRSIILPFVDMVFILRLFS